MKNRMLVFLGFIILALVFNSCEEDLFSVDPRDEITGEWLVSEDSNEFRKKDMHRIYTVDITKDLFDSTAFYIEGFYEISGKVKVIMKDTDFIIPEQTLEGFTIENGYGEVAANYSSMNFYYYVSFTDVKDVVSARYTRP